MSGDAEEKMIDVRYRIGSYRLPLAGLTVGEARTHLVELLHIDPAAANIVDGEHVDEKTVLAAGQVLCFVKRTGNIC